MGKPTYFLVALLLLLVAAITLLKRRPPPPPEVTGNEAGTLTPAERGRIERFWQLYRAATDHRIRGTPDSAVGAYARALELNPEHEDGLYYMGSVLFELGEFANAEQTWKRLVEINPASARAHSRLGNLYLCYGEWELFDLRAAEAEFQRALEIYKEETGPLLRLGEIALIRGDMTKARYYFDAVTGSNYRSVEAHLLKGYLAWRTGAMADAEALFATAVQHSRPEEPAGGVPGEGDTKQGSRPMVSRQRHCPGLQALVADLAQIEDADRIREMIVRYRRLEAVLQRVRRSVPH